MQGDWGGFTRELKQDRGWRVVIACAVGFGLGVNVLPFYTLGTFVVPLENAFGWSRAEVQGSLVFMVLATLVGAWLAGWLTDRFGVRRIALGGQFFLVAGLAALAAAPPHIGYWYAIWFLMSFTALGTTPITWTRMIAGWFSAGRGLALALALCGSGVAAIVVPPVAAWLIEGWGWRAAYIALSAMVLFIAVPVTVWLLPASAERPHSIAAERSRGETEGFGLDVGEALKSRRFWILLTTTLLLGFAISGTIPNLVPMMSDRGLAPAAAASLLGVLGASLILGRLVAGYALDHIWAPAVSAIILPIAALACTILASDVSDYRILAGAVILFGVATGAEFDLIPYIVTRYFGLKRYSQIYALQWVGWTVASGIAPAIFGYIFDSTGGYAPVLYAAAGCFLVSPLLLIALGPYPGPAAGQEGNDVRPRDDATSQPA